jgi:hypothetical protein
MCGKTVKIIASLLSLRSIWRVKLPDAIAWRDGRFLQNAPIASFGRNPRGEVATNLSISVLLPPINKNCFLTRRIMTGYRDIVETVVQSSLDAKHLNALF